MSYNLGAVPQLQPGDFGYSRIQTGTSQSNIWSAARCETFIKKIPSGVRPPGFLKDVCPQQSSIVPTPTPTPSPIPTSTPISTPTPTPSPLIDPTTGLPITPIPLTSSDSITIPGINYTIKKSTIMWGGIALGGFILISKIGRGKR